MSATTGGLPAAGEVSVVTPGAREAETPVELTAAPVACDGSDCETLLVVEDDPAVRAALCRALRRFGYFVLEASNGEDALLVMQKHHAPIHLLISDVMMPGMHGTELVEMLRGWYPRMRVLFISGYGAEFVEARQEVPDNTAFLAKPFAINKLVERVRGLLDAD